MKNKKGFTLIELLGVIILLAIILALAVVSYNKYLEGAKKKSFGIVTKSLETAAKSAYADCISNSSNNPFCQYHGELDSKYTYQIIYLSELIENSYIDEIKNPYDSEQLCDSSLSYVYVSNKSDSNVNNKDMVYEACLVCGDHKSESCRDDINVDNPNFGTTCTAYYDAVGGPLYDGNWTDRDVYLVFGATGDYRYGINEFQYTINDSNISKIDANKSTNTATLHLNKSVGNKLYKVQAIDGMNGKGTFVNCGANIKIDKSMIDSVSLSAKTESGKTVTSGNWVSEKVILSATVNPGISESGYLYQWYKDGLKFGGETSASTLTVDGAGTYKVTVTNQVRKLEKTSNDFVVKSDTDTPKVELVISDDITSGNWHASTFTIGYKDAGNISGNTYYYGTNANPTNVWTSLSVNTNSSSSAGTKYYFKVCSGAGLCDEISYVAKLDTSTPAAPTISANDNITDGNWHKDDVTISASGSSAISGITYYMDTNGNPSTSRSSLTISNNTTFNGTTYYAKACNGAGTCSSVSDYLVKLDKSVPPTPTLAVSDNIDSGNWHKDTFTITASGGTNVSGNTYHYGTTVATNLSGSTTTFSDNTTAVTYYYKICSGAGKCSVTPASYIVKLDKSSPTITAKSISNYITTTTGADITSFFDITETISLTSTVCKVGNTTVTNTNNLSLGSNTVTCTTTSGSGKSDSASTVFKHQYTANASCNSGDTLSSITTCSHSYQSGTNYSCPNGGTLNGQTCITTSSYGATCTNRTCTITVECLKYGSSFAASASNKDSYCSNACRGKKSCSCDCSYIGTGSASSAEYSCTPSWWDVCDKSVSGADCNGVSNATCTNYSCPNGGTLNGSTCTTTGSYNATGTPTYSTSTYTPSYSCPNGGTLSGTTCSF